MAHAHYERMAASTQLFRRQPTAATASGGPVALPARRQVALHAQPGLSNSQRSSADEGQRVGARGSALIAQPNPGVVVRVLF